VDKQVLEKQLVHSMDHIPSALEAFSKLCSIDLLSRDWTVRHGAALTLKSLAQQVSHTHAHEWFGAVVDKALFCMTCDRFDDFVGQHVVAPVRETCAQFLGVVFAKTSSNGVCFKFFISQ